jgi:MYXO-CTERM domain-containing protein
MDPVHPAKSSYWSSFWIDDVEVEVSTNPDMVALTVALTVFGNSGIIGFEASAEDNIAVENVDLYLDDALIGSSHASAIYVTATVLPGPHEARAIATDRSGRTGQSTAAFDVMVPPSDEEPPVVSANVSSTLDSVTLVAATDDVGVAVVEFYVDGAFRGRDTVAPYGLTLEGAPFGSTTHTLVVRAYDAAEKVGVSAHVLFAVGNRAPVVSAGPDASVNEGAAVTLQGAGSDVDGDALTYAWTQIGVTAVTLSNASAAGPTFTASLVTAATALTFRLTVNDGRGGTTTDSVVVTVTDVPASKKKGGGCSTGGNPSGVLLPLLSLAAAIRRRRQRP